MTDWSLQKQVEFKVIDILTNGNYINGVTAVEIAEKLSPELLSLFSTSMEGVLGDKEVFYAWFRRYNQAPEEVEEWLEKTIVPMARNELRAEQRKRLAALLGDK